MAAAKKQCFFVFVFVFFDFCTERGLHIRHSKSAVYK